MTANAQPRITEWTPLTPALVATLERGARLEHQRLARLLGEKRGTECR